MLAGKDEAELLWTLPFGAEPSYQWLHWTANTRRAFHAGERNPQWERRTASRLP
jgi:hypothetical protein